MGAFVSLLQRPPQETGFEAAAEGQNQALSAQALMQQMQMRKEQIAQAQMQTQEQQRAIADQDAFRKAYNESYNDPTVNSSEGRLAKFQEVAPKYGVNPAHTQELIKSTIENRKNLAVMNKDERENLEAHNKAIGIAAQGLLALPNDEARAAQLPSVVDDLVANHHITAEHGAALKANPPDVNTLGTLSAHAKSMDDFFKEQKEKDDEPLKQAQLKEAQGKALQTQVQNTSRALTLAAQDGKEAYAEAYYKTDKDLRAGFTHPDKYDPDKTPRDASLAGELPNQRLLREQAETNAKATKDFRDLTKQQQEERIELERQRLNKERGQTANSEAVDRRSAERELMGIETTEARLNKQRRDIGALLAKGTDKYDKPIDRASLEGQFEDVTNQLEDSLRNKYNAGARAGRGEPAVPLEQAIAAIRGENKAAPANPTPVGKQPAAKPAASNMPSSEIVKTLKEGVTLKDPDGKFWKKVNGVLVEQKTK